MRITIDLPDPILRQVQARAVLEGRKLRDLLADYVELGLARPVLSPANVEARRSEPPTFERSAASGETIPSLSNAEIATILDDEDAERCVRLTGR